MLETILKILHSSVPKIDGTILLCNYIIEDVKIINDLQQKDIIGNLSNHSLKNGDEILLEFSILKLRSVGIFTNKNNFIKQYRYAKPSSKVYLLDTREFLEDTSFYLKYTTVLELIGEIRESSKFTYDEEEITNVLIVKEDNSLFMGLIYENVDVEELSDVAVPLINAFVAILKEDNQLDKKNIYLNQLIEYVAKYEENKRFSLLLQNFIDFSNKAIATYSFYLRNFSYNKLKLELDSKALEFNQKLQSVINDSQTKLIAIPAAFILVLSNLDYENIESYKNIISTFGLFIFSILIQLFVNNQKSALKFIEENINYYKSTYKGQDKKEVEKAFQNVNSEKLKQSERILLIEVILWFVPVLTTCIILFLMPYKLLAILLLGFYSWIASTKILLKY